jgi:hypothetical protein
MAAGSRVHGPWRQGTGAAPFAPTAGQGDGPTFAGPWRWTTALALVAVLVAAPTSGWAKRRVEEAFAGQIVIAKERFPSNFSSQEGFAAYLRKVDLKQLWIDKTTGKWQFEYMCFFRAPIDDVELDVRFFDVTGGARRFVTAFEQYTSARGQRILAANVALEKPEFDINRKYLMVVENRGKVMANTTFTLRGDAPKYSGKVEFSDEDARQRDP